jgi:hypothetical protein
LTAKTTQGVRRPDVRCTGTAYRCNGLPKNCTHFQKILHAFTLNVHLRAVSAGRDFTLNAALLITACNDLTAKAVNLQAGKNATLVANNNIVLQTGQSTTALDSQRRSAETDGISSRTSDTQTQAGSTTALASLRLREWSSGKEKHLPPCHFFSHGKQTRNTKAGCLLPYLFTD